MIRAELKELPENLDQTYDRILQAVPRLHRRYVQSALHWLAFATRPMLLSELAEAAVIIPDEVFDPEASRLVEDGKILELCGALLSVSNVKPQYGAQDWLNEKLTREHGHVWRYNNKENVDRVVVSLSHQSVKEYLVSERLTQSALQMYYTSEAIANSFLSACCLNYIMAYSPDKVVAKLDFGEYPLLQYTTRNWESHWKSGQSCPDTQLKDTVRQLMYDLLNPDGRTSLANMLNSWNFEWVNDSTYRGYFSYDYNMTMNPNRHLPPLYIASYLGDLELVQHLVSLGCDVSETAGSFGNSLAVAAYHGRANIVKYLLKQGADPNIPCESKYANVLQTACIGGSREIVSDVLDAGANVNAQGGFYNTAIIAAMSNEHFDVVKLLIDHGADLNLESSEGSTLFTAASKGDIKMVSMLLGAGHDINHIGMADGTPLYGASEAGSIPAVQLLLRHGSDANIGGKGDYGYPLCAAAYGGHTQVCRILLRAGANANLHGGYNDITALECAIESRDMATFRVILESGCDPNAVADRYINAFHGAFWTGEIEMARILLKRGAEFEEVAFLESIQRYDQDPWFFDTMLERDGTVANAHGGDSGSALTTAITRGHETAAWRILDKQPYLDALGSNGTALRAAIDGGMKDLAVRLVELGADVSKCVGNDNSPLQAAIERELFDMADLLLDHGAIIDDGCSLTTAITRNSEKAITYLIGKGADVNSVDTNTKSTPLQHAAEQGHMEALRLLVKNGALVNGDDGENGDLVQYALFSRAESIVRFVLEQGARISEKEPGVSAIWKAVRFQMPGLIPLLLESGAQVDATEQGETGLGLAWLGGHDDTVAVLESHGAGFANIGGSVFLEAINKKPTCIKELLDAGVDPNTHDDYTSPVTVRTVALALQVGYTMC
jgi:ankyrin repeat protein